MLKRLSIDGIDKNAFPRLYIAECKADADLALANGLPFVRWKYGKEELIRQLLRPALEKLLPGLDWDRTLGPKRCVRSNVYMVPGNIEDDAPEREEAEYDMEAMLESQYDYDGRLDDITYLDQDIEVERNVDIATSRRDICSDNSFMGYDGYTPDKIPIADYVGDLTSSIDFDVIQRLGMMPKFIGDIYDIVRHNVSQNMRWTEGYTKKLGVPLGRFGCVKDLDNLLILDVSYSIPDGIAATLLTLADTMRTQCNAHVIITSRRSGYYPKGAEMPNPQTLRDYYGRANERTEFMDILDEHILGREWGNVISFGDDDCPGELYDRFLSRNTKVHQVHHFHTWKKDCPTGYARWVDEVCPNADCVYEDIGWCDFMNKEYRM